MKEENYRSAVECYTKAIDLDLRNAVYYCNRYLLKCCYCSEHEFADLCLSAGSKKPSRAEHDAMVELFEC